MSHTITISDDLFTRLEATARQRGISIEELLRSWPLPDQTPAPRDALARAAALGAALAARYGMMPDSTDLIRDDRAR